MNLVFKEEEKEQQTILGNQKKENHKETNQLENETNFKSTIG